MIETNLITAGDVVLWFFVAVAIIGIAVAVDDWIKRQAELDAEYIREADALIQRLAQKQYERDHDA